MDDDQSAAPSSDSSGVGTGEVHVLRSSTGLLVMMAGAAAIMIAFGVIEGNPVLPAVWAIVLAITVYRWKRCWVSVDAEDIAVQNMWRLDVLPIEQFDRVAGSWSTRIMAVDGTFVKFPLLIMGGAPRADEFINDAIDQLLDEELTDDELLETADDDEPLVNEE